MRGLKVPFVALVILTLVAGAAHAAPDVATVDATAAGDASRLPDAAGAVTAAARTSVDAAGAVADAIAGVARGVAGAVAALTSVIGNAAAATASALATGAVVVARALADAAVFLAGAAADAARTTGAFLAFTASLVAAGVQGAVALVADAVVALARGILFLVNGFLALEPKEQAAVAGAAGGTATGWSLWRAVKRFGWLGGIPMYSRLSRADLLKNPQRARVFEHVQAHPGVHPTALVHALDLGWGTIVYHLSRLEGGGFVRAEKQGSVKCYFAVGEGLSPGEQRQVAALRNDTARRLAAFVAANPASTQKDVARGVNASAALVSWHVKRLAECGVLRVEREGRTTRLFLADDVPATAVTPPTAPPTGVAAPARA